MGVVYDLNCCCKPTSNGGSIELVYNEYNWDENVDSLPFTTPSNTTRLDVNITAQITDLDITGQLPINLQKGSCVVIRKLNDDKFRIIYDDGQHEYRYLNRKGEFLCLEWNGSKYLVK